MLTWNYVYLMAVMKTYCFRKIPLDVASSFGSNSLTHLKNLLIVTVACLLFGAVTGCSSIPTTVSEQVDSATKISVATYRMIDQEIWDASTLARMDAEDDAQHAVRHWADRVWEQTEKDFIPWYVDYWTQQGLFFKYTWYQMNKGENTVTAAERLATHLKEQFSERVLKPVALETDPDKIADQAASAYIRVLADQIQDIPDRYQIPVAAFHRKLKQIPAIELPTRPPQNASLYEILTADDPVVNPAYTMLSDRNDPPADGIESRYTASRLDALANRAADKLAQKIALRGGGAAAAAIAGGGIGVVISAGFTAWSIIEHDKERPALEAELRESLRSALNETSRLLIEDRDHGVLASVYHMSLNIENHVWSAPFIDRQLEEDPSGNSEDIESLF